MKTEVNIKNGLTKIVLTPENEFESDVLEKVYRNKQEYELDVKVDGDYGYHEIKNTKIEIGINKKKNNNK